MKHILTFFYLLPFLGFSQSMTFEEGFTSFEILPSGIRTLNGSNTTSNNVSLGSRGVYPFASSSLHNVQFGRSNFITSTSGIGNIGIGSEAMRVFAIGDYNIGVGGLTFQSLTSGDHNIAIGYENALRLTTGNRNLILGKSNMLFNVTGSDNICIGNRIMSQVGSYGERNLSIGESNLLTNLASDNIAIGNGVLSENTVGNCNIAIGIASMLKNKTGNSNISLGLGSGSQNTVGNKNIAIGNQALFVNQNGSNNIAIGRNSLYSNTTSYAIAVGRDAATNVSSTAARSTSIGTLSNLSLTTGKDNISVGFFANRSNQTGFANTTLGAYALFNNTASGNVALGYRAGDAHVTENGNIFIGSFSDDASAAKDVMNSAALGYSATVASNNTYVLGNASVGSIGGYAGWTNYSDRRLKRDIVYSNELGLDFINDLKTAKYSYKADETERVLDGLIAQDVQATLNKLDLEWSGLVELDDELKTLTIAYNQLTIPLITATQELKVKLDKVKLMIADLEAENQALLTLNKQYNDFIAKKNTSKTSK